MPLALAVAALALYWVTLCPSVPGGDSGELIAVAATLGIAHPPGYPLYTLLGKLFSLLPFASPAAGVNFLSAVSSAASAGVFARALHRWTDSAWAAILGAGLFAFSPLNWQYSVVAEVFALHLLLLSLLLLCSVELALSRAPEWAWRTGLVGGLAISNHHTSVFLVAPLFLWQAWELRARMPWRRVTLAFALGLLPYLYLPWAALRDPKISWGDPSDWEGFLAHFLRREYGTFRLGIAEFTFGGKLVERLWIYLKDLASEATPVVPLFAGIGLWSARLGFSQKRRREKAGTDTARDRLGLVLGASLAGYLLVFCYLSNLRVDLPLHLAVQARFWLQANWAIFALAAFGLSRWEPIARRFAWKTPRAPLAALGLALLLVGAQAAARYRKSDQSANHVFERFARAALDSLPPGALLLNSTDFVTNSLRYLQSVEGYRPDVLILNQHLLAYRWHLRLVSRHFPGVIIPPGGVYNPQGYDMKAFLALNYPKFRVFGCNGFSRPWDKSPEKDYRSRPVGFVEEISRAGEPFDTAAWIRAADAAFAAFEPGITSNYGLESWENSVAQLYWGMRHFYGLRLADLSREKGGDLALLEKAASVLDDIVQRGRNAPPEFLKTAGVAQRALIDRKDLPTERKLAATRRMVAAFRAYLNQGPASDPEMASVRLVTEQAEARLATGR